MFRHTHTSPDQGGLLAGRDIGTRTFGDWVTKAVDVTYQAEEDGYVKVSIAASGTQQGRVDIKTDAATPPTVIRGAATGDAGTFSNKNGDCCPVKKNDYYLVSKFDGAGGAPTYSVYWIPLNP